MPDQTTEKIFAVLGVINAIQKFGVPAVKKIVDELEDKTAPTLEEIEDLTLLLKDPETYFEREPTGD